MADLPLSDRPLLVVGAPRMGTTWVAGVLSRAEGAALVNEPDNEWPNAFALKAKLSLGRFPVLHEGDEPPPSYEALWRRAFAGYTQTRTREAIARRLGGGEGAMPDLWRALCDHANPRVSPRLRVLAALSAAPSRRVRANLVVVKSVHAALALDWLAARLGPRVLVVLRHPLNVVASWLALGWGGCALDTHPKIRERHADRWGLPRLGEDASPLSRVAWEVGLFTSVLRAGVEEHEDWVGVTHDSLCTDPAGGFRELFDRLGMAWTEAAGAFLEEANRPGEGYATARVAAGLPGLWRRRLTREQVLEAWSVLSGVQAPWVEELARDLA